MFILNLVKEVLWGEGFGMLTRLVFFLRYMAYSQLMCFSLLSLTSVLAQSESSKPVIVYLSGGGGATLDELETRERKLRSLFETGSSNERASVKTFFPDAVWSFMGVTYRSYSQARLAEITTYLKNNQGAGLHIITSSMGGGVFRNSILPDIIGDLGEGETFKVGTYVSVESMDPGLQQHFSVPSQFDFDLYVSFETVYTGPGSDLFKSITGVGPLVPENNENCFFLSSFAEVNFDFPFDWAKAFAAHGGQVGNGEDRAQAIVRRSVQAHYSDNPQAIKADLLSILNRVKQEQPVVPVPTTENDSGGSYVTDGGVGPTGGGVGIESFPKWLSLKEYLRFYYSIIGE